MLVPCWIPPTSTADGRRGSDWQTALHLSELCPEVATGIFTLQAGEHEMLRVGSHIESLHRHASRAEMPSLLSVLLQHYENV